MGTVMPVGGIREKCMAARRAGVSCLIFPAANKRDFDELPDHLREGLEVHFARTYAEVFAVAFPEAGTLVAGGPAGEASAERLPAPVVGKGA